MELPARPNAPHVTHCCLFHGCKYASEKDCPVVQEEVLQKYLCEMCPNSVEDAETEIQKAEVKLNRARAMRDHVALIESNKERGK